MMEKEVGSRKSQEKERLLLVRSMRVVRRPHPRARTSRRPSPCTHQHGRGNACYDSNCKSLVRASLVWARRGRVPQG